MTVSDRHSSAVGTPSPDGRGVPSKKRRGWQPAWVFAAPAILILGIFVVFPIGQSFWFSLHKWRIGATTQEWLGAGNYERLLHDDLFWNALRVTSIFAVVNVVVLIILGYFAASALMKESWFTKFVRAVYFFPTIVALATIGIVWRFLLDPNIGLVGGITSALGHTPIAWLQDPQLALPSVIFVSVWKNLGFTMMILLAGLKGVPEQLYEAARIDGAQGFQVTRYVTIPSIRPTLLFATMILTINSLQMFDLVYVMTNGGPLFATDTLVTMMFREGFTNFDIGYASAIAWVLFLLILILSATQLRIFRYQDVD